MRRSSQPLILWFLCWDLALTALAWLGANEVPSPQVLLGGALVMGALAGNEWLGWRERQRLPTTTGDEHEPSPPTHLS